MHCVVAPLLHAYEDIPVGAQSCVVPPGQTDELPVIEQVGAWLVVTVLLQVLLQPLAFVIVTEYVPAPTVVHCVVAPLLQAYEDIPAGAQSWVVPPGQTEEVPVMEHGRLEPIVT